MGKFVITKSENGSFHFNLKAGNGEIILASEAYNSSSLRKRNGICAQKMPRKTRTIPQRIVHRKAVLQSESS
jgi:uncharacterized protein YegP (UPF0339 family)